MPGAGPEYMPRREEVRHDEEISQAEARVVRLISRVGVNRVVPDHVHVRVAFIFRDLDGCDFLRLAALYVIGKRQSAHIVLAVFGHLDIIDFPILVKVQIIDRIRLVQFLLDRFCIWCFFYELAKRFQIEAFR